VVHRIQRTLSAAATAGSVEIHPSASIGIALSSECEAPEDLLASADRAMYRAKALGPGHYGAGDAALRTHDSAVGAMEADLRRALDHDELALRFQPIISLATGGWRASRRWSAGSTRCGGCWARRRSADRRAQRPDRGHRPLGACAPPPASSRVDGALPVALPSR
jgi:predicted signal transduction protein with EAL and GGDEF domain